MSLLSHKLMMQNTSVDIEFVGSATASATTPGDFSVSLTSLSGGIASAPRDGDVIITTCTIAANDLSDRTQVKSGQGYTNILDRGETGLYYIRTNVDYKVLSAADTTITYERTGATDRPATVVTMVFRGVDNTSPIHTALSSALNDDTLLPNPPTVTTSIDEAYVIAGGGSNSASTGDTLTSSQLSDFDFELTEAGGLGCMSGMGYLFAETAGSYPIDQFGGADAGNANSVAIGFSLALQPR